MTYEYTSLTTTMSAIKLFCIPYSGGSATAYIKWKTFLSDDIVIYPVEIAGHGKRMKEPLYNEFDEAIEDIAYIIAKNLEPDDKYAILGHSMGSLLAFETYYKLVEMGIQTPCHMFFTGRKAPQNQSSKTEYYLLPDNEFLNIVYYYGGTTKEVMRNKELAEVFLPILRADFKLAETYIHEDKLEKIKCDITVVNGNSDRSVCEMDMNEWRYYAGSVCDVIAVPGDHFFLMNNCTYMTNIINKALISYK